jgi:hypothetical protein
MTGIDFYHYLPVSEELTPGYTFNIHVQSRSPPNNWQVIHLQVVDDRYEDGKYLIIADKKMSQEPLKMAVSLTKKAK